MTQEEIDAVSAIIKDNVEFVEESDPSEKESEKEMSSSVEQNEAEVYHCPECGAVITLDMTHCPKCGVEFEFKEDEE